MTPDWLGGGSGACPLPGRGAWYQGFLMNVSAISSARARYAGSPVSSVRSLSPRSSTPWLYDQMLSVLVFTPRLSGESFTSPAALIMATPSGAGELNHVQHRRAQSR